MGGNKAGAGSYSSAVDVIMISSTDVTYLLNLSLGVPRYLSTYTNGGLPGWNRAIAAGGRTQSEGESIIVSIFEYLSPQTSYCVTPLHSITCSSLYCYCSYSLTCS